MTIITYKNTMEYTFDNSRSGAKYNINGKWANHGEFLESVAKCYRGLDYVVNPNTSYDNGSDIEELKMSIKSSKATLASIYGNDFLEIVNTYFENVHSEVFTYMIDDDEMITEYQMNKAEFLQFVLRFAKLDKAKENLYKVRFSATTKKMVEWLVARA